MRDLPVVSPGQRHPERGGLIVVVSLCILGIALTVALATETFRLMASNLQMQNISEYSSEVVLADFSALSSGPISEAQIASRVSSVANGNRFLAQENSSEVDSGDVCFNSLNCPSGIKVLTGCYSPVSNTFTCWATAPTCAVGEARAAYVRIATFSKRRVALVMAKIFGVSEVNMSAGALSYASGSLFMTTATKTVNFSPTCG